MSSKITINEKDHEPVPGTGKRFANAIAAATAAFLLVQLLNFILFNGLRLTDFNMIPNFSLGAYISLYKVPIVTFIILCGVFGWFRGEYIAHRLIGYISNF